MPDPAKPNFRDVGGIVRFGERILRVSFEALASDRYLIRTSWPLIIVEFGDLVSGTPSGNGRRTFTSSELRFANKVCEVFSAMQYPRDHKKLTLMKARGKCYKDLGQIFRMPWHQARQISDVILCDLVRLAALDPYMAMLRRVQYASLVKDTGHARPLR